MRTTAIGAGVLLVVAIAGVVFAGQDDETTKPGWKAPSFEAKGSDGKTHTLASLTKEGPVTLYFIKDDCPVNAAALPFYKRIGAAYGNGANLIGVFNGDEKKFNAWNKEQKLPFTVIFDPDYKVIKSYKAQRSPWLVQVDKGVATKVWPGYCIPSLNELNASLAGTAKKPVAKLDFSAAPKSTRFG